LPRTSQSNNGKENKTAGLLLAEYIHVSPINLGFKVGRQAFDDLVKGIFAVIYIAPISRFSPDTNEFISQNIAG